MPEQLDSATIARLTEEGRALADLIHIEPENRPDKDFNRSVQITEFKRGALKYEIKADLPRKLDKCHNCNSQALMKHGRYVVRLVDLPYQDETGFVRPVEYSINAQRYKCSVCGAGDVEELPEDLQPILKSSRTTRRLSKWLLFQMQTRTTYDVIARMTGYSKVWARKWYAAVRAISSLPPKPANKPGRRRKEESR